MKIAIYNHGIQFDGETPFKQPLGGSESGIVYIARELARSGHQVTVYANLASPSGNNKGQETGPEYRHYHEFFTDYVRQAWDVLVGFRSFDPFLIGRVAPRMIYWTGDSCDQPTLDNFAHDALQSNIDRIFCVSEWHRRTFINTFGLAAEKVVATRNGFCADLVANPVAIKTKREWLRAAYTSTPFRGLDILLQLFPEMRRRAPEISLDVFSSMKVYGWSTEQDRASFGALYECARQDGVRWHGSVAQPVLLGHLAQCGLLLYPNTFDETSCIAAIEAQASGCVVVTSARAALNETVQNRKTGICLPGDPKSAEYQREFINTVCGLFDNPDRLLRLSEAARARAFREYTWAAIASEWTTLFEDMPAQPVHSRLSGPLTLLKKTHDYLQSGNLNAAKRVLITLDQTPFLRNEVEALKGKVNAWM